MPDKTTSLLQQAKQLFATRRAWLGEGGMPSDRAQLRANQCIQCPHNVERPWEEMFKGAVATQIRRQLELKSKLELKVEGEERLHICALCGCKLDLKIYTPLHIARENTPDWAQYPSYCWLKNERPQDEIKDIRT